MKKRLKKAFTLVELVVVIAIVAILSAVSVGGYFVFIEQAKVAELDTRKSEIINYVKSNVTSYEFVNNLILNQRIYYIYTQQGLEITANFAPADRKAIIFGFLSMISKNYELKYRLYNSAVNPNDKVPNETNWVFFPATDVGGKNPSSREGIREVECSYVVPSKKNYGNIPTLYNEVGIKGGNYSKYYSVCDFDYANQRTYIIMNKIGYISSYKQLIEIDI